MRIYFRRSGGFHGMRLQATVDTASLSTAEAEALEQMLEDANFFEAPSDLMSQDAPDRFTYELTVIDEQERHTVVFSEETTPEEFEALLRHLTRIARRPSSSNPDDLPAPNGEL